MKIEEVIYKVRQLYSKGKIVDDSTLRNRVVYFAILDARATLLRNMSTSRQHISKNAYQTLSRIKLVPRPVHELEGIPKGICVTRSEQELPAILSNHNGPLIDYVTSLDGDQHYDPISFSSLKYQKGRRYTTKSSGYFIRNDYLYLSNSDQEQLISLSPVFFNPLEAYEYAQYFGNSNENISHLAREFPFDNTKLDPLVQMAYNNLLIPFSKGEEDFVNDSENTAQ